MAAHSVELLFDPGAEAAIHREWVALAEAGLPSQAHHGSPSNRPHVTLTVATRIHPAVDTALCEPAGQLPLECVIGAPVVFGHRSLTLVRLIVPSAGLLRLHAWVDAICAPHVADEPFAHVRPGRWTPHVTLARRMSPADLPAALEAIDADDVVGAFAGLRRWDGEARIDTVIA
ncbi:2'-5' RNA ligase family protein [Mycobacterium antarcticum]|uniref:2'-5' RNA ligase family protein n=1 Tax=Mycolicibacterium sp. TUM20984 TaxID=3023368 RepID=UPI002390BB94|nr:2'-5' RNA ligase family protein [Mycolicibacterium sp. TUM20984]GLP83920.1 hypothetical protein TUM20984_53400 [Mycolicibacterium sp. TUM20984]